MRDMRRYQFIAIVAAGLVIMVAFLRPQPTSVPTNNRNLNNSSNNGNASLNQNTAPSNTNASILDDGIVFYTEDLPDADPAFAFSITIPAGWIADYDAAGKAIVFRDPAATAQDERLWVSYYGGPAFSALSSSSANVANISIDGHSARSATITGSTNDKPWGAASHRVVDVRTPDTKVNYRIEFGPTVTAKDSADILASMKLD